ncbi:MAG: ribonuclease III [Alphaproteobacteria bacterium]|nr:ribonuclease III [Alphaproteobacteria bacterium]
MELGQQNALGQIWIKKEAIMKLNYEFKNQELLNLALTQSGIDSKHNNERLEFVGDRVLGLSVALLLYDMYPNDVEGDLARRHAFLVSTETLAHVASTLELEKHLRHGHMTGGKIEHVLADAMEAVLGAIFLDSGFESARKIIVELWHDMAAAEIVAPKDAKTTLQEYVQKHTNGELPVYEYSEPNGALHNPEFTVTVTALGKSATGVGASKKLAGLNAAENLLKILAI